MWLNDLISKALHPLREIRVELQVIAERLEELNKTQDRMRRQCARIDALQTQTLYTRCVKACDGSKDSPYPASYPSHMEKCPKCGEHNRLYDLTMKIIRAGIDA